jgi:SAM-dependent methyltransferase
MSGTDSSSGKPVQPTRAKVWYNEHASEFVDADVIELDFVGKSSEFQDRLNHFKLWAVDELNLSGKHVLEFGAGHGRLALAYPGMASYLGVDYSTNLVEIGNRRLAKAGLAGRAQLVQGDVMSFDGPKRHYDVVCSLGMMCYFPDPAGVVAAMERFVKPGGQFFFDFRCESWIYAPIRRLKWALHPPTGGVTFAAHPKRVQAILADLGLKNIRVSAREFPLLAEHYARTGKPWPFKLRNALADSALARPFATDAWVFSTKA